MFFSLSNRTSFTPEITSTHLLIFLDNDHTHSNLSVPYFQEGYVHYVVDAVFTLVIAIQRLIEEKCRDQSSKGSLCPAFFPFDGNRLLTILRSVTFRNGLFRTLSSFSHHESITLDLSQRSIKFTDTGDGIGTYDIFQYQMIDSLSVLDYMTIGEFSDSDQSSDR
jgi:hypothetical protein